MKRVGPGVNYSFVITVDVSAVWITLNHLGFLLSVVAPAAAAAAARGCVKQDPAEATLLKQMTGSGSGCGCG